MKDWEAHGDQTKFNEKIYSEDLDKQSKAWAKNQAAIKDILLLVVIVVYYAMAEQRKNITAWTENSTKGKTNFEFSGFVSKQKKE